MKDFACCIKLSVSQYRTGSFCAVGNLEKSHTSEVRIRFLMMVVSRLRDVFQQMEKKIFGGC